MLTPAAPACCSSHAQGDSELEGTRPHPGILSSRHLQGHAWRIHLLRGQRHPRRTQAAPGPWGTQVRSWDGSKPPWRLSRAPSTGMLQQGRVCQAGHIPSSRLMPMRSPSHQPGAKPSGANSWLSQPRHFCHDPTERVPRGAATTRVASHQRSTRGHLSLASRGSPGSGKQMPPRDLHASSSFPKEPAVPCRGDRATPPTSKRCQPATKHSPKKSGDSQPRLRATREAADTRGTPGPRTEPLGPHPAPAAPVPPGQQPPATVGTCGAGKQNPLSVLTQQQLAAATGAASPHSPCCPLIPAAGAAAVAKNRG